MKKLLTILFSIFAFGSATAVAGTLNAELDSKSQELSKLRTNVLNGTTDAKTQAAVATCGTCGNE